MPDSSGPQPNSSLAEIVRHVAHLLPAQGPISVFIHHNTLHAFERIPFERAVVEAGDLFGCEPFLSEKDYRAALASGRIERADIDAVVEADLAAAATQPVAGLTRGEVLGIVLTHGIPEAPYPQVEWLVRETDLLQRLRRDLPEEARRRFSGAARASFAERSVHVAERLALEALWASCRRAVLGVELPIRARGRARRHRDLLLARTGVDCDDLGNALLTRACAAFLDQGMAYWPAPGRERGFFAWFTRLYRGERRQPEAWMRELGRLLVTEDDCDPLASLQRSLRALGVEGAEVEPFLAASALALRGWAGMMRQLEERPDRAPAFATGASLAGFLAVRLLVDRAAAAHLVAAHRLGASLAEIWAARSEAGEPAVRREASEVAWPLFHLAQLLGWSHIDVDRLTAADVRALVLELERFHSVERRRLLHLAYERRYRRSIFDALAQHPAAAGPRGQPTFQAVFCIDEREESLRRHLEEVVPECETYGTAGFFGVAMYYRAISDAHARPLCPIVIVPRHSVEEVAEDPGAELSELRRASRKRFGQIARGMTVASRTFVRGTVVAALGGALFAVPLVLRVLFPRFAAWLRVRGSRLVGPTRRTRLALERRDDKKPEHGEQSGFTHEEMADIVGAQLESIGLCSMSRLVLVIGHGSSSLNNPHESAHDCGACGGGHGGANARAFAQMANDPAVRALLAARGTKIPEETWFVGAEHNSCYDSIDYFDVARLPSSHEDRFREVRAALDEARRRNAHERCRRFDNAPEWFSEELALAHVAARSEDLAQPRPEYGHATNAFCVIGRRARTRGLFLDRRAFLMSYDPTQDDARGSLLARVLRAVVPVVAGINLEYYFGVVDPVGYGCATKLPHNITALLGVMDGHASDLRTGLPWQMVEIHEPVRLLTIVETTPALLTRILADDPQLAQLVENRWMQLATLDPGDGRIDAWGAGEFQPYQPSSHPLPVARSSKEYYRGRREHLPPAVIRSGASAPERG